MKLLIRLFIFLFIFLLETQACRAIDSRSLVGIIFSSDNAYYRETYHHFSQELSRLGYDSSQLKQFIQRPNADIFSWANSARRAEAAGATALVTFGSPVTRVALQETDSLPVVFSAASAPLDQELERLHDVTARALSNTSGIYGQVPVATLVKSYSEIVGPGSLTAIFHENDLDAPYLLQDLEKATSIYGLKLEPLYLRNQDFDSDLNNLVNKADGYFMPLGTFNDQQYDRLVQLLQLRNKPFISCGTGSSLNDSLINLQADAEEQGIIAARRLVEALNGTLQTGVDNFSMPRNVSLTVNVHIAKQLGLKIPFQVLTSATRIISHPEN